ncbi:hypothetical protein OIE68_33300 [Nocardia vinacea]|uniref:DUF5753 domain-containing protein n=1 Tax=Nocardia vinacea TaxID=96468 RepID=A0ABZ1Z418_9NOCA|nr:hypothetical protein OIE68_33300 [Nocardia vinacea]
MPAQHRQRRANDIERAEHYRLLISGARVDPAYADRLIEALFPILRT